MGTEETPNAVAVKRIGRAGWEKGCRQISEAAEGSQADAEDARAGLGEAQVLIPARR
jgi:hypothetical protein